jgi:hypothetical protein
MALPGPLLCRRRLRGTAPRRGRSGSPFVPFELARVERSTLLPVPFQQSRIRDLERRERQVEDPSGMTTAVAMAGKPRSLRRIT